MDYMRRKYRTNKGWPTVHQVEVQEQQGMENMRRKYRNNKVHGMDVYRNNKV
jgi:hypothetical protein